MASNVFSFYTTKKHLKQGIKQRKPNISSAEFAAIVRGVNKHKAVLQGKIDGAPVPSLEREAAWLDITEMVNQVTPSVCHREVYEVKNKWKNYKANVHRLKARAAARSASNDELLPEEVGDFDIETKALEMLDPLTVSSYDSMITGLSDTVHEDDEDEPESNRFDLNGSSAEQSTSTLRAAHGANESSDPSSGIGVPRKSYEGTSRLIALQEATLKRLRNIEAIQRERLVIDKEMLKLKREELSFRRFKLSHCRGCGHSFDVS